MPPVPSKTENQLDPLSGLYSHWYVGLLPVAVIEKLAVWPASMKAFEGSEVMAAVLQLTVNVATSEVAEEESQATFTMQRYW